MKLFPLFNDCQLIRKKIMKSKIRTLSLTTLLGGVLSAQAAPFLVPNGDFSIPDGDAWREAANEGVTIDFVPSGGNPGGHAQIDTTGPDQFGVIISEGGTGVNPAEVDGLLLTDLGLNAGERYTFSLDLIDLGSGGAMAGFKIESFSERGVISESGFISSSGDQNFTLTTSWANYSFDYLIEPTATRIKVIPLNAGFGAQSVGYDNVRFDDTPVPEPPFVAAQIENGGFEIPNGEGWGTTQGTPVFNTTEGNPDGHVVLDGSGGEFAVLYAFNNTAVSFASLGLAPGDTYIFQMDIRLISGVWAGAFRLEGGNGFVVEEPFEVIGNGAEWETYSVELTVPAAPAEAKFGLRPGNSVMAFDNVSIIRPGEEPFAVCIEQGTVVSWTPTSAINSYQPQESSDNTNWTDLGPLITGNAITSVFDEDGASFYRVQEFSVVASQLSRDGGFEAGGLWTFLEVPTEPERIPPVELENAADAFSGNWYVRIAADNSVPKEGLTPTSPRTSVMQQTSNITITEGDSYDLSFYVYVESNTNANLFYSVKWQNEEFGVISQTDGNLNGVTPGAWTLVTNPGIVVPPGAVNSFMEFGCATGAVEGAEGSYRVDDISLLGEASVFLQDLPATPGAGVVLSWPTTAGVNYQVKSSTDLVDFSDLGAPMIGDGSTMTLGEATATKKFFQVIETP